MADNDRDKNKPLSINEAINKLRVEAPRIEEATKREMSKAKITTADPRSRIKFLNYAISLLGDLDFDLKKKLPFNASSKEMAEILKALMYLRTNGISARQIAHRFGIERTVVMKVEKIATEAVKRVIARKLQNGTPILGEKQ